jgi:ankyrin repeat protein
MEITNCLKGVLIVTLIAFSGCRNKREIKTEVVIPVSVNTGIPDTILNSRLFEAALNGQLSQLMHLLDGGFDVNTRDNYGRTALMYSSYNGHTEIIRELIVKGASIDLQDTNGRTALMMASSGPWLAAVKLLLDNQADPNITDKDEHFTALMYAAAEGQLEVVRILLANRADPALKDIDGDDAESFASKNGHKEISELLKSIKK